MTKEEAIKILHSAIKKPNTKDGYLGQALDMAIKALEQNDILDKIREEIEQMDFDFGDFCDRTDIIRQMILEVIDKYRAESEGEE